MPNREYRCTLQIRVIHKTYYDADKGLYYIYVSQIIII